jgi:hypothetical protein
MQKEATPDNKAERHREQNMMWTHVLPFVIWILLMELLKPPTGWGYAVRTAVSLGVLCWMAPWRWYTRLQFRHIPLALVMGVVVCVVWIAPETPWMARMPGFEKAYRFVGMLMPWKETLPAEETPYAPAVCGWVFTIIRLLGSAVVIAIIEEFFWRGFLYRWIQDQEFWKVSPGVWHTGAFLLTALLFGLEHQRWLVGIAAGVGYGWLYIRTRDLWAVCLAHGVTNFLLGIYVIATGAYAFW